MLDTSAEVVSVGGTSHQATSDVEHGEVFGAVHDRLRALLLGLLLELGHAEFALAGRGVAHAEVGEHELLGLNAVREPARHTAGRVAALDGLLLQRAVERGLHAIARSTKDEVNSQ